MENVGKRLNKYISDSGTCSRREADRLIESGNVQIRRHARKGQPENEPVRAKLGDRVFAGDTVIVKGRELAHKEPRKIYLMLNKPAGVICTADERVEHNIIEYMDLPTRVSYAGRLDKDSTGLLILTNDGDLINSMMRAGNYHEKEYQCTVSKPITPEFLKKMSEGVKILLDDDAHKTRDHEEGVYVTTRSCQVRQLGERKFSITLTQGYNRQIRRMCRALGYGVSGLKRVRIMNLKLGDLKTGQSRYLTSSEVKALEDALYHG
jgi:23S rRNA pseudouridine2604 synthase